jgi:competence protein ComEC
MAGTELALRAWIGTTSVPLAAVLVAAALILALAMRVRRPLLTWAVVACVVAAVIAAGHDMGLAATAARLEAAAPTEWTGVVTGDPITGTFGTSVGVRLDAGALSATVRVNWPDGTAPPAYGDSVAFSARLRCADRLASNAGDLFRSGELLRATPWKVRSIGPAPGLLGAVAGWRNASVARFRAIGGRGAEALASMLFAARPQGDGAAAVEDARTAGVAWLITASGIHLGILVLLAERLAGLAGLGKRGRAAVCACTIVIVCVAAGLRLSLLRAALAGGAGVVARLLGRRRDATGGLAVAVLVLVLADPVAPYDVGLALAVTAVMSIALLAPLARVWLSPLIGGAAAWALGASVSAQAGIAPLAASLFGGVSPLGPVVLLLSAPVVEAAVAGGIVGSVTAPLLPAPGRALMCIASWLAGIATRIWAVVARLPGAVVPVAGAAPWFGAVWVGLGALLWIWWPAPKRAARVRIGALAVALALLLGSFAHTATGAATIDVMDIGQGDAILIRDGSHAVLVDTGPDPAVLRQALARAGVSSLEGVVLTHSHADHVGGLDGLAGLTRPEWIGLPDVVDSAVDGVAARAETRAGRVVRLRRDMTFDVGRVHARVLWPRGGERGLSANDTSVVLLLTVGGRTVLLLGDAEEQAQRGVLEAFASPVDVLKVAHHGSNNGNVPVALERWRPPLALISVGAHNTFGHPAAGALQELSSIGARVRRTDLEGDLLWDAWDAAGAGAAAQSGLVALCDNRGQERTYVLRTGAWRQGDLWRAAIWATSSPSISSTAPSRCCWSAPRSACATALPPWPTWTSTSTCSMAPRPPPTMC